MRSKIKLNIKITNILQNLIFLKNVLLDFENSKQHSTIFCETGYLNMTQILKNRNIWKIIKYALRIITEKYIEFYD